MKYLTLGDIKKLGKWEKFIKLMKSKRDPRDFEAILKRVPDYPIQFKVSDLSEMDMVDIKPMKFGEKNGKL